MFRKFKFIGQVEQKRYVGKGSIMYLYIEVYDRRRGYDYFGYSTFLVEPRYATDRFINSQMERN